MTIPTANIRMDYAGNGSAVTFPYNYKAFANTDLRVLLTEDATGVAVTQTLTTHYTVSGVGAESGGNVVMVTAPPVGYTLTILATIANTQTTDLVNETRFFQSRIEDRMDKLCRADQVQAEKQSRSMVLPESEAGDPTLTTLPPLAARKGKTQAYDAITGAPVMFSTASTAVSSVMEPVLQADTLALARSAMGSWDDISVGVCNVKDPAYGAVGDGVTDDTTAIQAAIDTGLGVLVPNGTFIFSTLNLADGVRIHGPGTLKRKTTAGISASESYAITASGVNDWSIEGVTIDGNKANQSGSAGFKVSGMLVVGCRNFRISGTTWKDWHEDGIELTSATQNNPSGPDTPGAKPSDTIRRGAICNNLFINCGRNVDDGSGYSASRALQIGSTTEDITVADNIIYDCIGGIQAAAYCYRLRITGNSIYVDSATLIYRSTGIAVEQMSDLCTVTGNTIEGFREGINAESVIRTSLVGNTILNCIRGINCFASSIGGVAINMRELVISSNTIKGSTSESIKVTKSGGNNAIGFVISGNVTRGGTFGINVDGLTGLTVVGNECTEAGAGIQVSNCISGVVAGNSARSNTTEGIGLSGCNGVSVKANHSTGNEYGIYLLAGQTDVTVDGNTLLVNGTKDLYIGTSSTNGVRHMNNRLATHTGAIKTIGADGASLKYIGDVVYLSALTYTNFVDHHAGQRITFVAVGSVTYDHNAASASKIYMVSGADVTDSANKARTFISDGSHLYEC